MRAIEQKVVDLYVHSTACPPVPEWFMEPDEDLQDIANGDGLVNGPLMQLLAKQMKYVNPQVAEPFRKGFPLIGMLPKTGDKTFHSSRIHVIRRCVHVQALVFQSSHARALAHLHACLRRTSLPS